MASIKEYLMPKNAKEAYELLIENSQNEVIGGGTFLKLLKKDINTAIDLSNAGLKYIKETENRIEIGGSTTFREIETSSVLKQYFGVLFEESVKNVMGIQFKNAATIGGNIYCKHGFSDLITVLLVLDCRVFLYKGGEVSLNDFLREKKKRKDIITKITIPKNGTKAVFKSFKNSYGDCSILNIAVSKSVNTYSISVGARPGVAVLATKSIEVLMTSNVISKELLERVSQDVSNELYFGNNNMASKEYRIELCKILVMRGLTEVCNEDFN